MADSFGIFNIEALYLHAGPHIGLPAGAYALALHRKHRNNASRVILSRYFSLLDVTNHGNIPDRYVSHLGCALGHHAHLGQLVGETQGDGRLVAARAGAVQHVGHRAIPILRPKVHTACLGRIPGSDFGSLGVLPIDGLIGGDCDISRIIHLYYIDARFLIVADAHAYPFTALEYAAAAIGLLGHARPRLLARLRGDADTTYLQRIFAIGQGVALLGQFVLRAGGEQGCRHEAYCCQ